MSKQAFEQGGKPVTKTSNQVNLNSTSRYELAHDEKEQTNKHVPAHDKD